MSPSRFACLLIGFLLLTATATAAEPTVRVGSLRYGTLSWQLDVIAKHGLDKQEGIRLEFLELAATPAAQLALQAGGVDLIVSDWLWVSRQRAEGGDLTFIPFSSAIGALIVPAASPIRDIAGLTGQRLGIAGSAIDKSWLVLRLYARKQLGLRSRRAGAEELRRSAAIKRGARSRTARRGADLLAFCRQARSARHAALAVDRRGSCRTRDSRRPAAHRLCRLGALGSGEPDGARRVHWCEPSGKCDSWRLPTRSGSG